MYGKYVLENKYKFVLLIQILEAVLIILLMYVSMHAANRLVYNVEHPFGYYRCRLYWLIAASLEMILLSARKYFNFFDTSFLKSISKSVEVVFMVNVAMIVLLYFSNSDEVTPYYFLIIGGFQVMSLLSVKVFSNRLKEHVFQRQLSIVIGEEADRNMLLEAVRKQTLGRVLFVSGKDRRLYFYVDKADYVYLLITSDLSLKEQIISYCELHDIQMFLVPESHEITMRDAVLTQISDVPLFAIEGYRLTEAQIIVKRCLDIFLSLIGIILVAPILLVVGILIKREDKGPVFYVQARCGRDQIPFSMIKLRSMVPDAEKWTGEVLAEKDDPRITKVGKWIRKTRIDEFPQFFNVFLGHMSIVGPRPERPVFVTEYLHRYPEYVHRFAVKPGITGLAQVLSNYTTTPQNKLKFDLMYIKKYSPGFDLGILIKTVGVLFSKEQAQGVSKTEEEPRPVEVAELAASLKNTRSRKRTCKPYSRKKVVAIWISCLVVVVAGTLLRYTVLTISVMEAMSVEIPINEEMGEEILVIEEEDIPTASLNESVMLSALDISKKVDNMDSKSKIHSVFLLLSNLSRKELLLVERLHQGGYTLQEIKIIQDIMRENFNDAELEGLKALAFEN
ncbi:sugar transferase [Alkalibacter rhizosphaerae]|nr:sugar transferase [Alkalibacter rhizosphaerae]